MAMTRSYRPLHIVDTTMFWSPSIGGVRRYLETKRAWFASQPAWRHTLVLPDGAAALPPGAVGVPSLPLPGSGGYRLPWQRAAAASVLADLAPDLIEANDPYRLAWSALDAAERLQVPSVAFCHSDLEQVARLHARAHGGERAASAAGAAARRYMRHLYRRFDLVLAPSRAMCGVLANCGVDSVQHQPLGVDASAFHPSRRSATLRAELGLPDGVPLLVYAGRFAPEKHLQIVADAVGRLNDGTVLLAIGAGPTPPRGERVIVRPFIGNAEALAAVIASADALVHAGDQETFGLTVLEAMACGTPVIARAARGLAELVDERVGMPVPANTVSAYVEAIRHYRGLDRRALSAAARQRALAHDWSAVLPQLAGRYLALLRVVPAASRVDAPVAEAASA